VFKQKKNEREVSKGCPQGSCTGPGFWNIQFNSLRNLDFGKRTKAIAFAHDLLIAVKVGTAKEAENFANIEISNNQMGSRQDHVQRTKVKSYGNH
jgi:hypothetical protein